MVGKNTISLGKAHIATIPWKVFHILALLTIGITALGYIFAGVPFPRPIFLYVGIGAAFSILFAKVIYSNKIPRIHQWVTLAEIVFFGFFLRASIYVRLAAGGVDTRRWANFFEVIVNTAHIPSGRMYYESPIFLLHLTIGRLLGPSKSIVPFGLEIYNSAGISIAVASLTPLLVFWIGTVVTGQPKVSLVSTFWAGPFFLFLRSSTLMQSEFLAIPWFILTIGSMLVVAKVRDVRWSGLFIFMGTTSVMLHFFYSAIITMVSLGTIFCYAAIQILWQRERRLSVTPLFIAALPAVLFMIYHVLTAGGGGGRAISIIAGIANFEIPQSILTIFIPTEGAAAESTGNATNTSFWRTVLIFAPATVFSIFAFLGGTGSLIRRNSFDNLYIYSTILIGAGTVLLLLLGLNSRLHFRLYYFVGTLLLVYIGYSIYFLDDLGRWKKSAKIILIIGFCVYAITSPMSPLGNNADSPVQESGWAVTESEWKERNIVNKPDDKYWQPVSCEVQDQVASGINYYCLP